MKKLDAVFQLPRYYNILSDFDKYQYSCLRLNLSTHYMKNQRNKRVENFTEILEIIRNFCVRGDGDDWRRFLVCGYCCFKDGIAINTRQLRLLIFKCKSSINGSLHKMGLSTNVSRTEAANSLMMAIPVLRDNVNELRQWTVRKYCSQLMHVDSPLASSPSVDATESDNSVESDSEMESTATKPLPIGTPIEEKLKTNSQNISTDIVNNTEEDLYNFSFDFDQCDPIDSLDFL